jgi:hypothetical protein
MFMPLGTYAVEKAINKPGGQKYLPHFTRLYSGDAAFIGESAGQAIWRRNNDHGDSSPGSLSRPGQPATPERS